MDHIELLLAQAPPAGAGAVPAAPGEPGLTGAESLPGGAPPQRGADPFGGFFPLLMVLLVAMILLPLIGQRRDKQRRQAHLAAIKKHDRVQTIGGVIGSIVEIKPDTVVLKVDETSNTRITFARSAIQQVLTSAPDAPQTEARAEPQAS
jgi:preprotein translocase subunit YajC